MKDFLSTSKMFLLFVGTIISFIVYKNYEKPEERPIAGDEKLMTNKDESYGVFKYNYFGEGFINELDPGDNNEYTIVPGPNPNFTISGDDDLRYTCPKRDDK